MRIHSLIVLTGFSLLVWSAGSADAQASAAKPSDVNSHVAGTVVTAEGKPAADAEVIWLEQNDDYDYEKRDTVRTDAQGKFQFAQSRPAPKSLWSRRSVTLLALTPDKGMGFQYLATKSNAPVALRLFPPTTLRVTFLDPAGKPIPNLAVRVDWILGDGANGAYINLPQGVVSRLEQKTDAKGEAGFRGLPQGMRVRFALTDEWFAALSYENAVSLTAAMTQTPQTVRLTSGGTIEGRVTFAETGKPAANLRIGAQAIGSGRGGGNAKTDANGNYRLTNLHPGNYNVMLYLRGDIEKNWTARALDAVTVMPNAVLKQQDMRLIPGIVITGKVTDKTTGKPIENVMVGIYGPAHPQSSASIQSATTDANGVYTARVPPGKQYVYISGIPYRENDGNYSELYERPKRGVDLRLDEDKTYTQDFALQPLAVRNYKPVRVKVVGTDGKPVANAQVFFHPISTESYLFDRMMPAETDSRGEAVIKSQTTSMRIRARAGNAATEKTAIVQNGESLTLTLLPNRMLTLTGQVTDDKGKPVPTAKVAIIEWQSDMGSSGSGVPVDAQGRYTFTDLWADSRYSLSVNAPGYSRGNSKTQTYPAGKVSKVEPIVLQRATGFVTGRVVDFNGDPVAKQRVMLGGGVHAEQETVTDAQGKFRFDQLVAAPFTLILPTDDNAFPIVEKRAQAGDRDVILVKPATNTSADREKWEKQREEQTALIGKPAPEWGVEAWINSADKLPDSLKGKIVLIDFWAMWCGPCVASLPAVQRIHEQYAAKGVVLIGVSGDDNLPKLKDFVKANGLTYPIAMDIPDPKKEGAGTTMRRYKITGIPDVAVIDRKGVLRYLGGSLDGAVGMIGEILAEEK